MVVHPLKIDKSINSRVSRLTLNSPKPVNFHKPRFSKNGCSSINRNASTDERNPSPEGTPKWTKKLPKRCCLTTKRNNCPTINLVFTHRSYLPAISPTTRTNKSLIDFACLPAFWTKNREGSESRQHESELWPIKDARARGGGVGEGVGAKL